MLRRGIKFTDAAGGHWKVEHVNQSRAHCVCLDTVTKTITDRKGRTRTFTAKKTDEMDISPNTPVEALKEMQTWK